MTAHETRDAQSGVEAVLARVLAEHEDFGLYSDAGGDTHYVCACDETKRPGTHRAHVAAAQAAALGEVLAAERAKALRSAAAEVYGATGQSAGVPVWRVDIADWLRRRANREQP